MVALGIALAGLALLGHAALWVGIVNRWHATGYPRRVVKSVTVLFYAALLVLPPAVVWRLAPAASSLESLDPRVWPWSWATAYVVLCAAYGGVHLPIWAARQWRAGRHPPAVRLERDEIIDLAERLGAPPTTSPRTRLFCRIPFNQLWQLHVSEFEVQLPGLPPSLDGFSICHLSDLHFSPRIERAYFDEVVRLANQMQVDLVALTGDVCDKRRFIDWIPHTLGQINARRGKFYVLGNHDLRTRDVERLRGEMDAAGFVDVGQRATTVDGAPLLVAGNERPWFDHACEPNSAPPDVFKLLLSHSPDQLAWARRHQFDLMLAGHTHGGQIRFPLLGPVICPSWYGTAYACGFFHESPTLLHVSRGTASLFPFRLNCRPELTRIVLRPST